MSEKNRIRKRQPDLRAWAKLALVLVSLSAFCASVRAQECTTEGDFTYQSHGETINVPGDYVGIQAAIDGGTYYENVNVTKRLTVRV